MLRNLSSATSSVDLRLELIYQGKLYKHIVHFLLSYLLFIYLFFGSDVKKEKRPPSPDDIIVLSDNEPSSPQMNGGSHFKDLDTDLLMVRTITCIIYCYKRIYLIS